MLNFLWEKRKSPRLECSISVWFKIEEAWYSNSHLDESELHAIAVDISENGIGLLSDYYIPDNTVLNITFVLFKTASLGMPKWHEPVHIKGKVCSAFPAEGNKFRIDICFTKLPAEYKEEINNFLSSVLKVSV